jgi:hypothetical protein
MKELRVGPCGEIALPEEVLGRYGMKERTPIRVIETRSGVLLVPLSEDPPSAQLQAELTAWQSLAAESWGAFDYVE